MTKSLQTYKSIFNQLATNHKLINDYGWGPAYNIGTERPMNFPYLWIEPVNTRIERGEGGYLTEFSSFNFHVFDKINKGDDNFHDASNDTHYILETLLTEIDQLQFFIESEMSISGDVNIEPSYETGDENVNGYVMNLTFLQPLRYTPCNNPIDGYFVEGTSGGQGVQVFQYVTVPVFDYYTGVTAPSLYALLSNTYTTGQTYSQTEINNILSYYFTSAETLTILNGYSLTSHTHALDDLSDVNTTGVQNGMVLKYSGGTWISGFDLSGSTVDLSGYYTTAQTYSNTQVDNLISGITGAQSLSDVLNVGNVMLNTQVITSEDSGSTFLINDGQILNSVTDILNNYSQTNLTTLNFTSYVQNFAGQNSQIISEPAQLTLATNGNTTGITYGIFHNVLSYSGFVFEIDTSVLPSHPPKIYCEVYVNGNYEETLNVYSTAPSTASTYILNTSGSILQPFLTGVTLRFINYTTYNSNITITPTTIGFDDEQTGYISLYDLAHQTSPTPSLQDVLNVGESATGNSIYLYGAGGSYNYTINTNDGYLTGYNDVNQFVKLNPENGLLSKQLFGQQGTVYSDSVINYFYTSGFSQYYSYSFPSKSGTFALTNDLIPYYTSSQTNTNFLSANTIFNAGVFSKPLIFNNGNGTITLSAGTYATYSDTNFSSPIVQTIIPTATYSFTDMVTNYLCVCGTTMVVLTDRSLINQSYLIPVLTVFRDGNDLYYIDWDEQAKGLSNKLSDRLVRTYRFVPETGGLVLGQSGLTVTLTQGVVWYGGVNITLTDFNSSVDTLEFWHHTSAGTWQEDVITTYNNSQYDNITNGLQSLNPNRYAVNWVYRVISNQKKCAIVLGNGDYKLSEAQASTAPLLPPELQSQFILVGRNIIGVGLSTGEVQSAFVTSFNRTPVTDHDQLGNVLPSSANQYHLTLTQYNNVSGFTIGNYYTSTQVNNNFLSANTSYYTQTQANANFLSANTSSFTSLSITNLSASTERIITTSGSGLLQNYLQTDNVCITDSTLIAALINPISWVNGLYTGTTTGAVEGQMYFGSYYCYTYNNSLFQRMLYSDYPAFVYTTNSTGSTSINNVYIASAITFTLPAANTMVFENIHIKNISSGDVTIVSNSLIDGVSSQILSSFAAMSLKIYNNAYWIS